jgi:hypothetical protein
MWPGLSRTLRRVSILEVEHGSRGREPRRAILFLRSSRRVVLKANSSSKTSSQVGMPEFAMILATHGGTSITTYCERALRVPWPDKHDNAFTGSNRERDSIKGKEVNPADPPLVPSAPPISHGAESGGRSTRLTLSRFQLRSVPSGGEVAIWAGGQHSIFGVLPRSESDAEATTSADRGVFRE